MPEWTRNRDEKPFQLWADLECRRLKDNKIVDPINAAADLAKEQAAKTKQGIIPLSECEEIL